MAWADLLLLAAWFAWPVIKWLAVTLLAFGLISGLASLGARE